MTNSWANFITAITQPADFVLTGIKEYEFQATKVDQQDYIVTFNRFKARGRTMADALHQLANQLDAEKIYGSEYFDPQLLKGERLRPCEYCGAAIYFAKTINDRWMPVDGSTVDADKIPFSRKKGEKKQRTYVIIDRGGVPHVQSVSQPGGQVWIAHPDVCGLADDAPKGEQLEARWKSNRKRFFERNRQLHGELRDFISEQRDTLP